MTNRFVPFTLNPYTPDTTYIDPMILPDSTWTDICVGIRRNTDTDAAGAENDLIRVNLGFETTSLSYQYCVEVRQNLQLWQK